MPPILRGLPEHDECLPELQWQHRPAAYFHVSDPVALAVDPEIGADEAPREAVRWVDMARHTLLLLRLQRPYFAYCLVCSLLATAAFVSTLFDLLSSHHQGFLEKGRHWQDVLEGGTWQSFCWTAVGLALCVEAVTLIVARRGGGCMRDWWCAFDAMVLTLTLMTWALTVVRSASPMREEAEEADLWLLALRFALQPCRVLATASLARKVQQMQKSNVDITFDVGEVAAQVNR
mmetsp:Transcript_15427/g.42394  ORF Transcript_15427/g.42394 Transcript_15427/m.42394 type:complete len:233 (+) Transcript_15427:118-816(+)